MKKPLTLLVAVLLLAIPALAACGGSSSASSTGSPAAGPTGGPGLVASWSLIGANDATIDLSTGITLTLTDTEASGFGGVNNYTTTFTSGPDGDLNFAQIASTKMAGSSEAMASETAYFAALDAVDGYTVHSNETELDLFVDETLVLTFTKQG